ncbi:MAG: DNA mismatch repair endonuclease MutL, partial [Gemmatimonadaceae bacterium]|nr:DNA mismatch repair endonuclease MutL [Gemmatimonadaceae bacterium]
MTAGSTTPTIAVLASDVADRIAAGEVVERPASVVKELVENALDAGATAIDLDVREGGRALIRVSDDGHGMDRANAARAIERHATSKIRDAEDLVGVLSFGFRGEALPAIGSVSQLTIETATEDGAGVTVDVAGGTLVGVRPAARRRGTSVSVASLFYNTPARQKFLRGARSEWRAIAETLTTLALVRRDVRFTVSHDGKEQMRLPVADSLRVRVAALWGNEVAERLVAVDDVAGPIRVSGLVERPTDVGTAARRTFLSVNGRAVRDTGLVRAAEAAYRTTIQAVMRPSVLLEVELPGGEVDVNVHPAKAEVRFRDRWHVERAVERAVRRALGTEDSAAAVGYVRTFLPSEPALG